MKRIFLIMLMLLLLGGCGVKGEDVVLPEKEKVVTESEDISFSVSEISETEKGVIDITVDNVEKPKTESAVNKATAVQKKSEVKENTSSGSKKEAQVEDEVRTENESVEVIQDTESEPSADVIETPAEPEKEKEPKVEEKPKSAYDYDFDIAKIRSDCIAIGKYMGLKHDGSLTPGNSTWWNPVTASESNQGTKLKNHLESYIRFHTLENLSSYGIDEISYFNIYTESIGNGKYKIYFLFA